MPGTIAAVLKYAKILAEGNFGYSKKTRWSGFKGGELVQPGNFDCSSSTGAILKLAGYPIDLSGTFYSGNIHQRAIAGGYVEGPNPKGKSLAWLIEHVTAGAVLSGPGHVVVGMGDGKILSFEHSENGTDDGKLGRQPGERVGIRDLYVRSKTWTGLALPKPETVVQSTALAFRAAQASQEAPYFGGKANAEQIGKAIAKLGASVVGLTETQLTGAPIGSAKAAARRAGIMAAIGKGWKRVAREAVCIMWDGAKWSKGSVESIRFGTRTADVWHRAIAVKLWRKDAKRWVTFVEAHPRPRSMYGSDAAAAKGKAADIAAAIALGKQVANGSPIVFLGDWATDADALMRSTAYRASLNVDSWSTKKGIQNIDAIYLTADLEGSEPKEFNPDGISDHVWLSVHVELATLTTV